MIENEIYKTLTHGYDKNGLSWQEGMGRARDVINRMSNVELMELICQHIDSALLYKEDAK